MSSDQTDTGHLVKPKVIVDCDPGHDDAVALLMAARHAELVGITTVSGNVPLDATTRNAMVVNELADLGVEVHAGARTPLLRGPVHAEAVHGETGLGGVDLPPVAGEVASDDAVGFIIETVRTTPDVWLVPIGPLTNVALALRAAPDIAQRLGGISLMGGASNGGNITATAEFNVFADPHAAAITFASGVSSLTMCGLDVTHQFNVDATHVERLRSEPSDTCRFVSDLLEFSLVVHKDRTGLDHSPLHDPCAVMALTHPELFVFADRHVAVETDGTLTAGMTVVDARPRPAAAPNCRTAVSIDARGAMELVLSTLATFN